MSTARMWTRIDGNVLRDPRLLRVTSRSARFFYIEMLCYSNDQGTDGFIEYALMRSVTTVARPRGLIRVLIDVGLLSETTYEDGRKGVTLVAFFDDQLSREEVEKRAQSDRVRKERSRRHNAGDHSKCDPERCWELKRVTRDRTHPETHPETPYETKLNETTLNEQRRGSEGEETNPPAPPDPAGGRPVSPAKPDDDSAEDDDDEYCGFNESEWNALTEEEQQKERENYDTEFEDDRLDELAEESADTPSFKQPRGKVKPMRLEL